MKSASGHRYPQTRHRYPQTPRVVCDKCLIAAALVDGLCRTCRAAREDMLAYVATTTLVNGRRVEIKPCECSALMVAGLDHTCDPDMRRDGGLAWT